MPVQSFTYAHGLHTLKELQEEATGVRLACITTTQRLLANIPQSVTPVNSFSLLGHFQLDSVQTAALRAVVYSFVKRVPLVYPLCTPCIRFIERDEYPLQHFTIMQGVLPAQTSTVNVLAATRGYLLLLAEATLPAKTMHVHDHACARIRTTFTFTLHVAKGCVH